MVREIISGALSFTRRVSIIVLFTLVRWAIGLIFIGGILYLVDILLSNPNAGTFLQNLYRAFLSMLSAILAVLKMTFYTLLGQSSAVNLNSQLMIISLTALMGHLLVSVLSAVIDPFFMVLRIVNIVLSPILVSTGTDAAIVFRNGVPYPTSCKDGIPDYKVGDIIFIRLIDDAFRPIFDFRFEFRACAFINTSDGIGMKINPDESEIKEGWFCQTVQSKSIGEMFYIDSFWNNLVNRNLIPKSVMLEISGFIENAISSIFGDYSGSRLIQHHFLIDRLETDSAGNILPNQGDQPFATFIQEKMASGFGCPN